MPSSETGSSILSNALFSWVGDFMELGKKRQPNIDDLFEPPSKYLPDESWMRFSKHSRKENSLTWNLLQFWLSRAMYMNIRNVLYKLVSQKTLCKKSCSGSHDGDDSKESSDGRIYNIATSDMMRISKLLSLLELFFVLPVKLLVGAYYMYKLLGLAGLLGTMILVAVVRLSQSLVARARKIEVNIGVLNDQRLAMTKDIVQGISSIKLFGWGTRFVELIGSKRAKQLSGTWERAKIWSLINLVTVGSLPLINFASFYLFSIYSGLEAETVFTAISVFKIVQRSVDTFPSMMASVTSFRVSLHRIEQFLNQPDIQRLEDRVCSGATDDSLGFRNATLAWATANTSHTDPLLSADRMPFALKGISIEFPIGKLSLVGGPTGSGKSALLAALVGEMDLIEGSVCVPISTMPIDSSFTSVPGYGLDQLAYVSQEPWLRNASIRDNILFGEPYCQDRYEKVLGMCTLRPDLCMFPAGDMTEVGERGITLSGGQKQRVSLARAVYSSRQILLIDDCLSAVDAQTGRHILHHCLASSDEIMCNRTRILVTHHMPMCLSHSEFVVLLDAGIASFQGTPQQLIASNGDFNDSDLAVTGKCSDSVDTTQPSQDELNAQRLSGMAEHDRHGRIIEDETRAKGAVTLQTWKVYLDPCGGWRFVAGSLICVAGAQLLAVYKDYYLATRIEGIDRAAATSSSLALYDKQASMLVLLATYLGIGTASAIISALALLCFYACGIRASTTLHNRLFLAIVHATPRFLDTTPIGRIMSRFTKDMQVIDEDIMEILFLFMRYLLSLVISLIVVSSAIPLFAIVGVLVMASYVYFTLQFMHAQREAKRLEGVGMGPILSLYSEMIPGCSVIRAFNMQREYMDEMQLRLSSLICADFVLRSTRRWVGVRLGFASSLVSFFTALFVILGIGKISAGLAGFILIYAASYWSDALALVNRYNDLELSLNCVERVHQYMAIEQEAASETAKDRQIPVEWPGSGNLFVGNVTAGYTIDQPVLRSISFDARHGERIGIVGRTGAGKSTLSRALLRLVEPTSGNIVLDGVDILDLGLERLRQSITIIPQDPVLFNGTIRFNLDPFNDHPDLTLISALRRTLLLKQQQQQQDSQGSSVAAFVTLDDEIVSNGQNLSLGQRQLVALARALVRKSRLIVLDEATASVDFATDHSMQNAIRGPEFSGSTLLCIAHRLRTIIDYDRVLVLDNGKVVEFDAPQQLLKQKDSHFYNMCEQSGEMDVLQQMLNKRTGV
ncbi:Transporter of the ATP-binding cassette (ABC) [Coemansia sp. RSA 1646]|nr:Transporter of the ATP-binding cassette (ABC) [Coemansia sp. RSA 1646]